MKLINGWYLPDTEKNYLDYFKQLNTNEYQKEQRDASLALIDNTRIALDIGANIGLWGKDFCKIFKKVILFEPYKENIDCLKKNLENYNNFKIEECALSNYSGHGQLFIDDNGLGNNTLYTTSELKNEVKVNVMKLDDYDLNEIDYIKIDVQYHELEVIEGGINTLKKNRPLLCIEAARRTTEEREYVKKFKRILKDLDYKIVGAIGKEIFFKKISL